MFFVVIMGVGYAYWQDVLTINATVDTGCLDVQFQEIPENESSDYDIGSTWYQNGVKDYDGSHYMDVSVQPSSDNHVLSCTFTDIYPGSGGFISFRVANTGTIPAKLAGVTAENVNETIDGLRDEFNYNVHSLIIYKEGELPTIIPSRTASSFDDFINILSDLMDDFVLEPGEYIELNPGDYYMDQCGYNIEMPFGNRENNEFQNQTFSFQLKLHFEQVK